MKKLFYIFVLFSIVDSPAQAVFRDSVVFKKTNPPVIDTVCITDSFLNYNNNSKHRLKVLSVNLPTNWDLFSITSEPPQILYPKVGDSTTLVIFDFKTAGVCIITKNQRGYGSVSLSIEDITKTGTKKNVKFILSTKDSFIQIAEDSIFSSIPNVQNLGATSLKLKNKFKNIGSGDVIKWKLQNTKLVIPSTWTLMSIKDNNQVYPYSGVNLEKSFNYVTPTATEDNSLEVEFKHDKKIGYGSLILSVYREVDSIATVRNIKFSLLTTGTNSINIINDETDRLLYYYDENIFIDKEFKNYSLKVYDLNSKIVLYNQSINDAYLSTGKLPKGTYVAMILDKGQVIKNIKFSK